MSNQATNHARRVIPLRPASPEPGPSGQRPPVPRPVPSAPAPKEPLWRDLVGDVLRQERLAQERTLKDVADAARISMPYLSEVERGRKEASSEVLAAAARALGLSLADLLSRAHGELARITARRTPGSRVTSVTGSSTTSATSALVALAAGSRAPSAPRRGGLCLAA
ncbi:helix-turn-helix transcriptional regulator [Streptomyces sp. NPDC051207]|uniref:helix-turn-helix domain-containing protein n=1 Tax=Streptomyces sp. NPDC051207 TaxID=3154641 RepID=UPI0034260307